MTESISARFTSKVDNIVDPIPKSKGQEIKSILNNDPPDEQISSSSNTATPFQNNLNNQTKDTPSATFSGNEFNNTNISRPRSSLSTVSNPVISSRKRHLSDLLSPRPEYSSDPNTSGPQQSLRTSVSCSPSCSSASDCSSCSSCYSSNSTSASSSTGSSSTSSRITSVSMQGPPLLQNKSKSLKRRRIPPPLNISPTSKDAPTRHKHLHTNNEKIKNPIPSSAVSSRFKPQSNVVQPRSAPADVTTFQKAQNLIKPKVVYLGKENKAPNKIQNHGVIGGPNLQVPVQGWYPPLNGLRNTGRYPIAAGNTPISAVSPQFPYYPMYPMTPWGTPTNIGMNVPQGIYPYPYPYPNTYPNQYPSQATAFNNTNTTHNIAKPLTYHNSTPPPKFKGKKMKISKVNNNIQSQSHKFKVNEVTVNQTTSLRNTFQNEQTSESATPMQKNNVKSDSGKENNDIMSGEIRLMSDVFSFEFPKNSIPTKKGIKNQTSSNVNNFSKQLFMNICGRIWDESQLLQ
ncbi:similar to Saccharomyces cerevisiae YDR480W DIG2 MAP kinase-responsive inhibitor of the Ste12p transcription factor [Maudiozyma saulgeensis]|uniref:Similar to Saccharomyces cerevisiae YDR480W DIG2 MAP kinase-responsive inhibitor of the Ste12p transcription factor n=1 Tax=Maudiozyma saulgeensis TaxID=1789683 RepID=A0A1X7R5K2_9SACH|nr:similar to Saccharomyces cerevisiae YDR480W DIG2 MAP kinase-responsive inhibitor of the Ste12p transcription factor [Kazachstania saulgeensis]